MDAFFEGGEGGGRRVRIVESEPCLPHFAEHGLGADAQVVLFIEKQPELRSEIEIRFVVRRGGEKDDLAVVPLKVFADGLIDFYPFGIRCQSLWRAEQAVGPVAELKRIYKACFSNEVCWFVGLAVISKGMELDVFIPAHPKDYAVLPHAMRSIVDFLSPRIRSITVIAKESSAQLERILKSTGARFLEEDTVIPGLKRADIPGIPFKGEDRSGWYFQQFVKWGIIHHSSNEHYLVVDADTVFISNTRFFQNGKIVCYRTRQHHLPYFQTYKKLLGYAPTRQDSFIANYMVFTPAIVRELISAIERRNGKPWFESILDAIDRNTMSSFSEYETYGYYLSRFHPERFASQNKAALNLFSPFFRVHDLTMRLARGTFHSIAYHNYRR